MITRRRLLRTRAQCPQSWRGRRRVNGSYSNHACPIIPFEVRPVPLQQGRRGGVRPLVGKVHEADAAQVIIAVSACPRVLVLVQYQEVVTEMRIQQGGGIAAFQVPY